MSSLLLGLALRLDEFNDLLRSSYGNEGALDAQGLAGPRGA
jgi:hypothetical protein